MAYVAAEPTLSVIFLPDWKKLGPKTSADQWLVFTSTENPQQRSIATLANLLGRKQLFRDMPTADFRTVINGLEKGLPIQTLDRVTELIGVNREVLSRVLDVSSRTLSRHKLLKPAVSERLFRVSVLFQKALEVMGEQAAARHWFTTPKKALGGKTPLEFAESEIGAREVEDLLGRIEYGVYA